MIRHLIRHSYPQHITGALLTLLLAAPAAAQVRTDAPSLPANSPFMGGVPDGQATPEPIALSIGGAIRRALDHNLGVLEASEDVSHARGDRWAALSQLLPNISGGVSQTRRKSSLEVFGFSLGPGFPRVVGPYNVFDARVFLSQSVLNLSAINDARAEAHNLAAAQHSYRSARDLVVLVAANLYLEGLASSARAETARAQRDTADALYRQAQDLRAAGMVAGIDVVRAEVRLSSDKQRATAAENDFQKTKLQLARVIGLAIGQTFNLSDQLPAVPLPEMTMDEALERAYRDRPDYLAAQERVHAAESAKKAALAENLPSLSLNADYGATGLRADNSLSTYSVAGTVTVPIFQGGRAQAAAIQADADLRTRKAQAEDLRASIYYDVRSAFLDLQATGEELQAATRGRELAGLQMTQARDRFAAGVANNIEVIQAQEAVTLANEQFISATYGYNVSKALLARSLGTAESAVEKYLGGSRQ